MTNKITGFHLISKHYQYLERAMARRGMTVPYTIEFDPLGDGHKHLRRTETATLDELSKALKEMQNNTANETCDLIILQQEKIAIEFIQTRIARKAPASQSITVMEALFPHLDPQKKSAERLAKDAAWLAIREDEALKIDPDTAEIIRISEDEMDPYGLYDEWELHPDFRCYSRGNWARRPGSDIWVSFNSLPREIVKRMYERAEAARAIFVN